jgi:hypothetical protein
VIDVAIPQVLFGEATSEQLEDYLHEQLDAVSSRFTAALLVRYETMLWRHCLLAIECNLSPIDLDAAAAAAAGYSPSSMVNVRAMLQSSTWRALLRTGRWLNDASMFQIRVQANSLITQLMVCMIFGFVVSVCRLFEILFRPPFVGHSACARFRCRRDDARRCVCTRHSFDYAQRRSLLDPQQQQQ